MADPFSGISLASRALRSLQRQLDTTGHNIANVNNPAFSRQRVDLATTTPDEFFSTNRFHQIGTGVSVTRIGRIRDMMLESRRQTSFSEQGRHQGNLASLEKVASTFLDVDGKGISSSLDQFFNSWSALGSDPTNVGLRHQVRAAGSDLAQKVRGAYAGLAGQSATQSAEITETIGQMQRLAGRIAELNESIRASVAAGGSPNDAFDLRDEAIGQLSQLANVSTFDQPDGTKLVAIGGFTLVDEVGTWPLPTTFDAATNSLTQGPVSWPITGGKLRGLFDSVNSTAAYTSQLDTFANALRTQINAVHRTGTNPAGLPNQNFFNDVTPPALPTGAIDFDLDPAVLASVNAIAAGSTSASGDGSIALAISQLRDLRLVGLGNQTFGSFHNNLLGQVGRDLQRAKNDLSTANALGQQIENQIQAVSGVNLDEEMADMMRFQRSYQAAARVLTMMDQNLQEVLNIIR